MKFPQEIVFKKDKATLHVISKRCEGSKHFQWHNLFENCSCKYIINGKKNLHALCCNCQNNFCKGFIKLENKRFSFMKNSWISCYIKSCKQRAKFSV